MIETAWTYPPFPFCLVATPQPIHPREMPSLLERLLEDAAGLAGLLAAAAAQDETDQADVTFALRLLAEHLHATVALWRAWRAHEDPDEED